jgi:hypothetical protein
VINYLAVRWALVPTWAKIAALAAIIMLESTWGPGCGPTRPSVTP